MRVCKRNVFQNILHSILDHLCSDLHFFDFVEQHVLTCTIVLSNQKDVYLNLNGRESCVKYFRRLLPCCSRTLTCLTQRLFSILQFIFKMPARDSLGQCRVESKKLWRYPRMRLRMRMRLQMPISGSGVFGCRKKHKKDDDVHFHLFSKI